jgi:hypothetical protein
MLVVAVKRLLDVVKESNKRMRSDVVLTPLDFVRLLNARWRSWKIETPLDMLRVLNREKRIKKTTEQLLERVRARVK